MIVKQIKYYDEGEKQFLNNPIGITAEKLVSGEYFNTIICNEIQIKTYPGTVLKINGEDIIIGEVGVYNILFRENMEITSLTVDKESIDFIKNTPLAYLVITFIQDDETASSSSNTNTDTDTDDEGDSSDSDDIINPDDKEILPPDNHDNRIAKN